MRPVVFSASSINSYLNCRLQWFFTYVLGAEGESSEARETGSLTHEAAEYLLKGEPKKAVGVVKSHPEVSPLVEVFLLDILPTYRKVVMVEQSFQLEINDIPVSGILDSLDEQDTAEVLGRNSLILRDLKTTGSRPSAGRYRLNMILYYLGARDLGFTPDIIQLDYIVRTRKPYYWPEAQYVPDEDEIAAFAATLAAVNRGVAEQDYRPTGLGTWTCSACGHAAICEPYQTYKENIRG